MMQQIDRFLTIRSDDEDIRRRGRNGVIIALGLSVLALVFLPGTLTQLTTAGVMADVGGLVLFAVVIALARSGRATFAAILLVGTIMLAILGVLAAGGITDALFYLPLAVLVSGLVLRPRAIWVVVAASAAGLALIIAMMPGQPLNDLRIFQILQTAVALIAVTGLIAYLGAASTSTALREVQRARDEIAGAAAALEQANGGLESKIAARTIELSAALESQHGQAAQLQASLVAQQSLNELLNAMSLPIIPVRADVLVVPLVGNIDGVRAQQLISDVLAQVHAQRARAIILDITGVALVDTHLAQTLLRIADATRLLGAATMLVGIRPEVAQTLVSLGADLSGLRTAATLQDGLAAIGV